jgi:hypothetical protein
MSLDIKVKTKNIFLKLYKTSSGAWQTQPISFLSLSEFLSFFTSFHWLCDVCVSQHLTYFFLIF